MSGSVLSSQSLISQNLPVAIPQATGLPPIQNSSSYASGLITTVTGSQATTVYLPSGTLINLNKPPTIILSPYNPSITVVSAYVDTIKDTGFVISQTDGNSWSGVFYYKYILLNEF
jgi:hypothetical protein